MLYKHLPMTRFLKVYMMRIILDAAAAFRELFKGKFRHFWAIATAHDHFLLRIVSANRKRKELIEKNLPFHTEDMSPILLPWQYFIRKRVYASQLIDKTNKV